MNVWILTREINEYEQDGAYFVAVFAERPSTLQLADVFSKKSLDGVGLSVFDALALMEHIRAGGGRRNNEDTWYNLTEVAVLSNKEDDNGS